MSCTCGRIAIGMEVTEQRNWNPDCVEHGEGTDWYNDPERVAKRALYRERLIDLQRQAREARDKI